MNNNPLFSERYGYQSPALPITIRYEAPPILRMGVLSTAKKSGFTSEELGRVICNVLDAIPDEECNWGESNVTQECKNLISACEWFEVYDICEALAIESSLEKRGDFSNKINEFLIKKGVGWKMEKNQLSVRGEEDYEMTTVMAQSILDKLDKPTASGKLKQALDDISRRPKADITGAIQHSMASLECFTRDIFGSKKTLGAFIEGLNLPKPVDVAVEKMWGFASNQGRHIKEGKMPNFAEAMLTVHFCSALIAYLSQKDVKYK